MKLSFIQNTILLLQLLLIQFSRCDWTLASSDLSQDIFQPSDITDWSDSRVFACSKFNTRSMMGGYQKFSGQSSTSKTYSNIPPHFRVRIQFTLFFIDCINNSQKNEAVKINADGKEVFSFSPYSLSSTQEFCGSNSFTDSVKDFTAEFSHSNEQIQVQFFDTFQQTLQSVSKSWGVRGISILILPCNERCATCSGDWSNQCLSCFDNQTLNSNSECICKDGYYYQNYQCLAADQGATSCEIQIYQEIDNIVVQVSSILVQNNSYLNISVQLIFSYTKTTIPSACKSQMLMKMMIRQQITNEYIDFNSSLAQYITSNVAGQQIITQIPFSQISALSQVQNKEGDTIFSVLELAVNIGTTKKYIRVNRFSVYTSLGNLSSQINTFATNIDEQVTDGCKTTNDDCIVIADLDMESNICSDQTCKQTKTDTSFTVGDQIFIQVKFKYPKFTKFITNSSAYFKGDNMVMNFSSLISIVSQTEGVTIFSIPLVQPSSNCILQLTVDIKDEPNSRLLRTLAVDTATEQSQQVLKLANFSVVSKVVDETTNGKTQQTSASLINLCLILQLISLLFIL